MSPLESAAGAAAMVSALPQTFVPSFQVMPAASQSARVSGCGASSAANEYPPQATPNVNARTSTGDLIAIPPSDDGILTIPHSNFTLQHSFCGPEQGRGGTKYHVKDSEGRCQGSTMGSLQSRGRFCVAFAALVFGALLPVPGLVRTAEPTLEIAVGGETRSYTRDELLAESDATTLEVAKDVTYGGT